MYIVVVDPCGFYRLSWILPPLPIVRPFVPLLPQIEPPDKRIVFKEKLLCASVTLFIYLVCCQIPSYGVKNSKASDPLYFVRAVLAASNRGTLMELGISPIITSSMVMQFLAGTRIIQVDGGLKKDRALFTGSKKLMGLIICFAEAAMYVFSGMYGDLSVLGTGNDILIIT